ncbi:phosphoribosyl-AMP cyclohydrolase [Methyloligella sp. 2.7D]|uniref:phosphoribosyl-AMP cyclohydrolase n=1 Tax=unclassified Methyloligella TaxID=2625955 RepID=UPI00157BD5D5|nr:phosphoribosyl-AMP cyclohydrolase [Methyloligella sp. GL2]QKP77308.1 phosphoribosyl-AMP cyclohydrolase [Methyloligella sp. GL2]
MSSAPPSSADQTGKQALEEGTAFTPRFGPDGTLPVVATDAKTGQVLMLAYMNDEALRLTLETGEAHYFSRSRNKLWKKGETSGNTQKVVELRTDCDQDAVWMLVEMRGEKAACHTGRRTCFYRAASSAPDGSTRLRFVDDNKLFDPAKTYDH